MLFGSLLTFVALTSFVRYEPGRGVIVKKRTHILRFKNFKSPNNKPGGIQHISLEFNELDPICNTIAFKNLLESLKELQRQIKFLYL